MKKIFFLLIIITFTACHFNQNKTINQIKQNKPLAFPTAEGFGQYATGGRGGKVLFVTNLNDAGEGSFRAAVETEGARYILFKISGTIALKSAVRIKKGDLTIAGQTASGDGICIKNYPVYVEADNVIVRYLRFRLGDEAEQQDDAFGGRFHKNIIIDHCSMSWSTDECVSFYGNENMTLQWCIIAESLSNSAHEKGQHGYGGIWGGKNASFHHNLLAHHSSRNPRLGEVRKDSFPLTDLTDLRNNVIYNWGDNSCYGGEAMNVNIVNCYYKPGAASKHRERIIEIWKYETPQYATYDVFGKFYIAGNYIEGNENATNDNWKYGVDFKQSYGEITATQLDTIRKKTEHSIVGNVKTHDAKVAYELVLKSAGASFKRDAVDTRIIENVRKGDYTAAGSKGSKNGIIDSQNDVGGYPILKSENSPKDTSNDGMSDDWKIKKGLKPTVYQANGRDLDRNYDNVEVYLNDLLN